MGTIVALGGGGDLFDCVRSCGELRKVKKAVYIGFATDSPEQGYRDMKKDAEERFGIMLEHLSPELAFSEQEKAAEMLLNTDLIYVDGGNTIKLIKTLRDSGTDRILKRIYEETDIILSGASAGAICWCKYGNSDSRSFPGNEGKRARVSGLGILDILYCPHALWDTYRPNDLKQMMKHTFGIPAVAVDGAALIVHNGMFKAVALLDFHIAYKSYWDHGQYAMENIISDEYLPLEALTRKGPVR